MGDDDDRPRRGSSDMRMWVMILCGCLGVVVILVGVFAYDHAVEAAAEQRAQESRAQAAAAASEQRAAFQAGAAPTAASVEERAEHVVCAPSWMRCYDENDAFGNVAGRLVADVEASGVVSHATYEKGDAPPAVRACMEKKVIGLRVPSWSGRPARVRCDYAGVYMNAKNASVHYNAAFAWVTTP